MTLNQVTVPSTDVSRAVSFYRVLGLQLIVDALPRYARFLCPDGQATFSIRLYGIAASGSYDGYVLIHVKKGRDFVVTDQSFQTVPGNESILSYIAATHAEAPPQCINEALTAAAEQPAYVEGLVFISIDEVETELAQSCPPPSGGGPNPSAGNDEDCPEVAEFFRDCGEDKNQLSGGRYLSINSYFEDVNQGLPSVEDNIVWTFTIPEFSSATDEEDNLEISTSAVVNQINSQTVGVFVEPEFRGFLNRSDVAIFPAGESAYLYQEFWDPELDDGEIPFFLVRAVENHVAPPRGSRPLGKIGFIKRRRFGGDQKFDFSAHLTNTNWVPFDFGNQNTAGGINYVRGLPSNEWDPSKIGDKIRVEIYETDRQVAVAETTVSNSSQTTENVSITQTSNVGEAIEEDGSSSSSSRGTQAAYSFNEGNTITFQYKYSITSDKIVPVGTLLLLYQQGPNFDRYPMPVIESADLPIGSGRFLNSWGWDEVPPNNPFTLGSTERCRLIGGADLKKAEIIDVIK